MNDASNEMQDIKVVLIEDHDLTRVGLRTALQGQASIQIVGEAADGTQGLSILEAAHPDVAVVDIGLPDMDGIELTRKFKQHLEAEGNVNTKVLILTMHDSEDSVLAAFAAGADSYCMKDISIEQLTEAIRATHSGNAWVDPAIANVVLRQVKKDASSPASIAEKTVEIGALDSEYEQILDSYPLTGRELEILELIVAGCSNADIAERLYITVGTVKTHVRNILSKLCASDRTQAAVRALRSGLVT